MQFLQADWIGIVASIEPDQFAMKLDVGCDLLLD